MKKSFQVTYMLLFCALSTWAQKNVQIKEVIYKEPSNTGSAIYWVNDNDASWKKKPVFELADAKSKTSAKGYLATTNKNILIHIIVKDDNHYSDVQDGDIWNSDGLQIGFDVRGDSTGKGQTDAGGILGADDASIAFALSKKGPQAWVFNAEDEKKTGELKNVVKVVRNEKTKTTTYDIVLPWSWLNSSPGVYPYFRWAVQVNDIDKADPKTTQRLMYGDGGGGSYKTFLFKKHTYDKLPQNYVGSNVTASVLWNATDSAERIYAIASAKPLTLTAQVGNDKTSYTIPGDNKVHKISVKAVSQSPIAYDWLITTINGKSDSMLIKTPSLIVERFTKHLDSLLPSSTHPLLTRHIKSVKSLILNEWGNLQLYEEKRKAQAQETLKFIENIANGFAADAGKWETYLEGKRPLFFAFISKKDRNLSHYAFMLPKDWNPDKEYPLFLELHGSGNVNPLSGPSSQLGVGNQRLDNLGYDTPKTYAQIERNGYHLYPFGRGNSFYVDIGEVDVFEALEDVENNFKIDEDRRYLYGFSMGGAGTWSIASRTPDLWAAIAIYAGVYLDAPEKQIATNLKHTPIWMWCGETDFLYPHMKRLEKDLKNAGLKPEVTYVPGLSHNYTGKAQADGVKWLQQFKRKKPDTISFIADTEEHLGIWGIKMAPDQTKGLSSFTCTINGDKVFIETKNAIALEVDLGEHGLDLQDKATIVWNGKEVYSGDIGLIYITDKGATKHDKPARFWFDGRPFRGF